MGGGRRVSRAMVRRGRCWALRSRGFSLVELVVVLAVIGVLLAIALPLLGRQREAARAVQCLANLRGQGDVIEALRGEHGGRWAFESIPFDPGNPGAPVDLGERTGVPALMPLYQLAAHDAIAKAVDPGWTDGPWRAHELFVCPADRDGRLVGSPVAVSIALQPGGASFDDRRSWRASMGLSYNALWASAAEVIGYRIRRDDPASARSAERLLERHPAVPIVFDELSFHGAGPPGIVFGTDRIAGAHGLFRDGSVGGVDGVTREEWSALTEDIQRTLEALGPVDLGDG